MTTLTAMDGPGILAVLAAWRAHDWIRALDESLARLLWSEARRTDQACPPALLLAAALTSHQVGRGHVCLDLKTLLQTPDVVLALPPDDEPLSEDLVRPSELLTGWTLAAWKQALEHPWVVANAGDRPLILQDDRLYLRRYWAYEQQIIRGIEQRLADPPEIHLNRLANTLTKLFGATPAKGTVDWQKVACALAARERFAVLTGGPGTGKTTTVVKLLATLQTQVLEMGQPPLTIRLAAPTGKAAARLNDSIRQQTIKFPEWFGAELGGRLSESVLAEKVSTVHRLLGTLPNGQGFRHQRWNRLDVDVVVVDEASMVDVQLMASLFSALPDHARLILLGDKDQLASVEAGAVLSQLCSRAEIGGYWASTRDWLKQIADVSLPGAYVLLPPESSSSTDTQLLPGLADEPVPAGRQRLDQAITMLRHSHRFSATSGIGRLAQAVNASASTTAWDCFKSNPQGDLRWHKIDRPQSAALIELILSGYRPYLELISAGPNSSDAQSVDQWAKQVLELQGTFQLLCAVRRGSWGLQALNEMAVSVLKRADLLVGSSTWYPGRPVMVTRNDYTLRLMNGDIGITLPVPESGPSSVGSADRDASQRGGARITPGTESLRVVFPDSESESGLRWILPTRLGNVETVFAMTVHKSQGSEFKRVALVLPDHPSPILTRELVYTGITRAVEHFTLVGSRPEVLDTAIRQRIQRTSGPLSSGATSESTKVCETNY